MRTIAASLLAVASAACIDPQTQAMIDMAQSLDRNMKNGTFAAALAPHVEGRLAAQTRGGEQSAMIFDACRSGEPEGFFGVDLMSSASRATLRVTRDPIDGTRAKLTRGATSVAFDAKACSVLQADIDKTGTKINGVTLLTGKVTLDCKTDDGGSLAGQVAFSQCQKMQNGAALAAAFSGGAQDPEIAAATSLPEHVDLPSLPAAVRALRVHASARVVGATVLGEAPEAAQRACLENARSFCREVGWTTVEDGRQDLDVEVACSGHVTYRENASALEIVLPPTDQPSVVLSAHGTLVDTLPVGPRGLRCDLPGPSAGRTQACNVRASVWGTARLAGLLARSTALAAFAQGKRP